MRNIRKSKLALALFSTGFIFTLSCGKSIYKPVSSNKSDEAKTQDAIIALNNDKYGEASAKLSEVWSTNKGNEIAQLYSVAILGEAGVNLFCLVKQSLSISAGQDPNSSPSCPHVTISESATTSTTSNTTASGNDILNNISALVASSLTDDALVKIKSAIEILKLAQDQTSPGIVFQKCLIGGIYAAPALTSLLSSIETIKATLAALPAKVGASTGSCTGSAAAVAEAGQELTNIITTVGKLSARISDVTEILGSCLPAGSTDSVNSLTKQVTSLLEKADKGCNIPATGDLGASVALPTCMNSFITASSSGAVAGDKIVSGCEIFLNCSGGSCFSEE